MDWSEAAVAIAGITGTFLAPNWLRGRAEERQDRRAMRRATRLVAHELELNTVLLKFVAEIVNDPTATQVLSDHELEHSDWEEQRPFLAVSEAVSDTLWQELARTYTTIGTAERAIPKLTRGDAVQVKRPHRLGYRCNHARRRA